mmetsp:Transcript_10850/g.25878  ORF Transcript_10850/g.25878 Transcript_10850/m.25878 type:complete len:104 (+) Transcript_10850:315-626(+)
MTIVASTHSAATTTVYCIANNLRTRPIGATSTSPTENKTKRMHHCVFASLPPSLALAIVDRSRISHYRPAPLATLYKRRQELALASSRKLYAGSRDLGFAIDA